MARAGLLDHRKFKKLVYLLREPVPHCLGYLECLWTVAYQARSAFIGDFLDIGLATQFPGEPEKICNALAAAGFIDKRPDGDFEVHDLAEHAPRHVQLAMKRRPMSAHQSFSERPMSAHRASIDHEEKRREEKNKEPPLPPFFEIIPESLKSSPEFVQLWTDWNTHCREKKSKVTKTAATKQLAKLAEWGLSRALAAVKHSTANGWTGIFEPKPNGTDESNHVCRVPSDQKVADWTPT